MEMNATLPELSTNSSQTSNLLPIKEEHPEKNATTIDNITCTFAEDNSSESEISTASYLQNISLLPIKQEFTEESATALDSTACILETSNGGLAIDISSRNFEPSSTQDILENPYSHPNSTSGTFSSQSDNVPLIKLVYLTSTIPLNEEADEGTSSLPGNEVVINANSGSPHDAGSSLNTDHSTSNDHCVRKKRKYRKLTMKKKKEIFKKCVVCSKKINVQQLSAHMTVHELRGELKCKMCDIVIKTYSSWLQHTHGDCEKLTYKCHICGKGFQRKDILEIHTRIHSQERPFQCNRCDSAFKQRAHLLKHRDNLHPEESDGNPEVDPVQVAKNSFLDKDCRECSICNLTFSTESGLVRHLNIHINEPRLNQKFYKCQNCGEEVRTKFNLKVHRRNCKADESILLEMKEKAFASREYKCTICEKVFHGENTFVTHLKKHRFDYSSTTPSKPGNDYECPVCQLVFSSYHSLLGHKRTHSNQQRSPSKTDEISTPTQSEGTRNSSPIETIQQVYVVQK